MSRARLYSEYSTRCIERMLLGVPFHERLRRTQQSVSLASSHHSQTLPCMSCRLKAFDSTYIAQPDATWTRYRKPRTFRDIIEGWEAVARMQPRCTWLQQPDQFLCLHRIDENASGQVAPLLAYLRKLPRRHSGALLVVHSW